MRKYYIDNIRNLGILLLFLYHTCMVYNGFESFYIHGGYVRLCSDFILLTSIWFMPLLFLLSGISSYFSLERRSWKQYVKERFLKLFLPMVVGVLLLVPVQTYYAERFHNNYTGSYLGQYILFFTKPTDLAGYSGGFTPAHLWFLIYLFIIALITLPFMLKIKASKGSFIRHFSSPVKMIILFVIPFISSAILDIEGKSLGQFTALALMGFLMCKYDEILDSVEKYRLLYGALAVISSAVLYYIYHSVGWRSGFSPAAIALSALRHFIMWISILAILGFGKRHLNFKSKATTYFTKASFQVYIFHQSWLILIAYYIFKTTDIFIVQFISIIILTFVASVLTYEAGKRIWHRIIERVINLSSRPKERKPNV